MCGISGACLTAPLPDLERRVARMNALLAHRGPDSAGQFSRGGVTIAMRRLAIIDLVSGDQPVTSEDRNVAAVLNGEIYNFRELTEELEASGCRFRTKSDTEVLVHGYRTWGAQLCEKLKGMFAFAVFDVPANRVLIARDRFGEKPLFFHERDGGLVFASEIRALMEWPGIGRRLDHEAFGYFLRLGFAPSPLTLFADVRELPPGSMLVWEGGRVSQRRYYRPDYTPDPAPGGHAEAVEAVRAALDGAVRRQMVSDVPIGAFLSGGVDSSAVVAMLQRASARPVKTFTVRFEEASYDESPIAREVARHLGTEHTEITVANAGFQPDDLWRIVEHVGQPFPDSSAIPTYVISREVRRHVKVCLTGDGGDEMFAGYPVFQWAASVDRLGAIPAPLLRAARAVAAAAAPLPGLGSLPALRQAVRGLEAAAQPPGLRLATVMSLFLPGEIECVVGPGDVLDTATGRLELFSALPAEATGWSPLRKRMYTLLTQGLPQDMLVKTDRMSMACSLELRAPMLDPDLAALTMRLPDDELIDGGIQKRVLREAVRPFLPESVFSHPKRGFSIPLHKFQNEAYREAAYDLLSGSDGPMGLLAPGAAAACLKRGLTRKKDRADVSVYRASHQLWALMQVAAWSRRFHVTV